MRDRPETRDRTLYHQIENPIANRRKPKMRTLRILLQVLAIGLGGLELDNDR